MFEQFRAWFNAPVITTINEGLRAMTSREETAYSNLTATIESVRSGWTSLVAERDSYKAALEQADADQAQAVQDALAADSDHDAAAIEQADASLAELVAQPAPESQPEPAPEAPADGDVPVDGDQPA